MLFRSYNRTLARWYIVRKWYKPGSILFRNGEIPHRLILKSRFDIASTRVINKYPPYTIKQPSISLIFTTMKYRNWGIYKSDGFHIHTEGLHY